MTKTGKRLRAQVGGQGGAELFLDLLRALARLVEVDVK